MASAHIAELRKQCFTDDGGVVAGCHSTTYADEVQDILQFQGIMANFWNSTKDGKAHASTVVVALHNIVTSTIDKKFDAERHRYYCVAEALDKLARSSMMEVEEGRSTLQYDEEMMEASSALGLGQHRLKNCSVRQG